MTFLIIGAILGNVGAFYAGRAFQGYAYLRNNTEDQMGFAFRAGIFTLAAALFVFASIGVLAK
jgi:CDP-diglyceride synthetase